MVTAINGIIKASSTWLMVNRVLHNPWDWTDQRRFKTEGLFARAMSLHSTRKSSGSGLYASPAVNAVGKLAFVLLLVLQKINKHVQLSTLAVMLTESHRYHCTYCAPD